MTLLEEPTPKTASPPPNSASARAGHRRTKQPGRQGVGKERKEDAAAWPIDPQALEALSTSEQTVKPREPDATSKPAVKRPEQPKAASPPLQLSLPDSADPVWRRRHGLRPPRRDHAVGRERRVRARRHPGSAQDHARHGPRARQRHRPNSAVARWQSCRGAPRQELREPHDGSERGVRRSAVELSFSASQRPAGRPHVCGHLHIRDAD